MSSRTCAKPGCSVVAGATLTYDYSARTAWVELLGSEAHPMQYDLCAAHADHLRVPQGWAFQDRRVRYPAALHHTGDHAVDHAIAS